jgi:ArsR family transcriptional regulator
VPDPRCAAPGSRAPSRAGARTRPDVKGCAIGIDECRFVDVQETGAFYRLLGDEARLRLLRVLAKQRLNVTELTGVLGIAQSGVSRHLGLLRDAGLVSEEREGGFTFYRIPPDADAGSRAPVWAVLRAQFAAARDAAVRADDARLQEVLRLRHENFEARDGERRQLVPGRSWAAWARALGHLLPPLVVADLGCGEGYLTLEAARWASRVIAVDRSERVLRDARALARRRRRRNILWKRGELEALPIRDASVDVALLSQALHHAEKPAVALAEARRIVRPGGRLLLLDLRRHDEAWVRQRFGDRWLGFDDRELEALLAGAGWRDIRIDVGARRTGDPFTVLVASGTRADGVAARGATRSKKAAPKARAS